MNNIFTRNIEWPEYIKKKENILMLVFCVLVFRMVSVQGDKSFINAENVMQFEHVFIILYILVMRDISRWSRLIKEHSVTIIILLLWVASITFSFFYSPFDISDKDIAQERYYQTLSHVLLFLFVWDFVHTYSPPLKWLIYTIIASSFYVIYIFFIEINSNPNIEATIVRDPPLNSNIRYTGIQVMGALGFSYILFLFRKKINIYQLATIIIITSTLWAFLFWLGGRGTILSMMLSAIILGGVLYIKKQELRLYIKIILLSIILGVFLAELFAVFKWNSMFHHVDRTIEAESVGKLSSGRLKLWATSWNAVKDHLPFGLGSQGYFYIPDRKLGTVQPHSMIVQFLVEWGVVGSILFFLLLIKGFMNGVKLHIMNSVGSGNIYAYVSGMIIVAYTGIGLIDGSYYHPQPLAYLAIAFAIWNVPPEKLPRT